MAFPSSTILKTAEDEEWDRLLDRVMMRLNFNEETNTFIRNTLVCNDKRQKGCCSCIQRSILDCHVIGSQKINENSEKRLYRIACISYNSHKLKTERNPIAGRRYSDSFANHVIDFRAELSTYKLCQKAIASVLHCSLNFLYRDNNNKQKPTKNIDQIIAVNCCEKQCLRTLCVSYAEQVGGWRNKLEQKDSKGEDNRMVYFDLRDHETEPCTKAIREITGLSKATLNNLSTKDRSFIRHGLQGRKRHPSNTESDQAKTLNQIHTPKFQLTRNSVIMTPPSTAHYDVSPIINHNVFVKMEQKIEIPENGICVADKCYEVNVGECTPPTSKVFPGMRCRLNAIKEEPIEATEYKSNCCIENKQIVTEEDYQGEINDTMFDPIPKPIKSPTTSIPVQSERRPTKRKTMPGLIRITNREIDLCEHVESPQLHLSESPFSPDKKCKPSPISSTIIRNTTVTNISDCLDTPTITPNTPSNSKTNESSITSCNTIFNWA